MIQKTQNKINHITGLKRILASRYTIPVIIFTIYFTLNQGIGGPAILSDEVGYLDKASTIAGSVVHLTASWFGGYSFMISPAFILSSNPYIEWKIILVLNALMWAGSAAILQYILRYTHPKAKARAIWLATLGAMIYPSWLSMSGYAYSTSGFVLVFMGALAAIIKSDLNHRGWLCLAGILAGYLCWIHPLGYLFLVLFVLLLTLQGFIRKQWQLTVISISSFAFAVGYLIIVQPWLNNLMSGSIVNDNHYMSGYANILHAVTKLHYWLQVGELLLGFILFAIVATFGLAVHGSLPIIKQLLRQRKSWRVTLQDTGFIVRLLSVLLVVTVICFTALLWGANKQLRIDHWVYGRYTDMYLLPLIAYGLLASWRIKQAVVAAGIVIIAGFTLTLTTNSANTLLLNFKVTIQGFWPIHIASNVHANYFWLWGILGAVGIVVVGIMGTKQRKRYLVLLLIPVIITGAGNYWYHLTITLRHSKVSSLYPYLKHHYTSDDCIGFTPEPDMYERFELYSYYLHGYNFKKMSLDQWRKESCKGPYLTYDSTLTLSPDLQISGLEKHTGLLMITHTKNANVSHQNYNIEELLHNPPPDTIIFN